MEVIFKKLGRTANGGIYRNYWMADKRPQQTTFFDIDIGEKMINKQFANNNW